MKEMLFVFQEGIGNCAEAIPTYLGLREKFDIDVVYLTIYPTDSVEKASFVPCEDITECTMYEIDSLIEQYEWCVRPPFLTRKNGDEHDYVHKVTENINELDSEVLRNMKILEYFDLPMEIKRDFTMFPSNHSGDIVVHNGALKGWDRKKYSYMKEVVDILIKKGYNVSCIGSPEEYIAGNNCTGTSLKTTIGTIFNHKVYLGTDTGTYHLAALMNKPGVAVFTATDPNKNWDKEFHSSISIAKTLLPCQPCQNGYHYMPEWSECKEEYCKNLDPNQVIKMVEGKLNGI